MKLTPEERAARKAVRAEVAARIAVAKAATRAIVQTGRCPQCGRGLRRNSSLAGWWQCEQLGAETHRADSTQPPCSWQGFTE